MNLDILSENILKTSAVVILSFIVLDIILTYVAVCRFSAVELNTMVISGVQKIGYIPFITVYFLAIAAPMAILIRRLRRTVWVKRIIAGMLLIVSAWYLIVIAHNVFIVDSLSEGRQPIGKIVEVVEEAYIISEGNLNTTEHMEKINSIFNREKFCRLFP